MKTISILLIIILFSITATSQIRKNNWLVGGNAAFSSINNTSIVTGGDKQTNIQISPVIGYFVIDKLALGLKPSYSYIKTTLVFSNSFNAFRIGPFIRYYFLNTSNRVNLLSEVDYQYSITHLTGNPNSNSNSFSFLAGPVVYFNTCVGIEFTINYSFTKYAGDKDNKNSSVQLGIGLQVHLEKDK